MKIIDNLPDFSKKNSIKMSDALKSAASDVLIKAKDRAPYKTGALRSQSDVEKVGSLTWRIRFWVEYARFQELGGNAKRSVRNYSTTGTGKHFLRTSGDEVKGKLVSEFRKHAGRII